VISIKHQNNYRNGLKPIFLLLLAHQRGHQQWTTKNIVLDSLDLDLDDEYTEGKGEYFAYVARALGSPPRNHRISKLGVGFRVTRKFRIR
jgi:hypothetical protein